APLRHCVRVRSRSLAASGEDDRATPSTGAATTLGVDGPAAVLLMRDASSSDHLRDGAKSVSSRVWGYQRSGTGANASSSSRKATPLRGLRRVHRDQDRAGA